MARGPAVNPPLKPHLAEDPMWRATFRGFFWGEGWLGIERVKSRRHGSNIYTHRPCVNIAQANSNRAVLFHIQEVLGGFVYERKSAYSSQGAKDLPVYTWMGRNNSVARKVHDILAEESFFPDKKLETKVQAFGAFLDLIEGASGRNRTEAERAECDRLRSLIAPASLS